MPQPPAQSSNHHSSHAGARGIASFALVMLFPNKGRSLQWRLRTD